MNLEVFSYDSSLEEIVSEIKLKRNRYLFKQRLQLLIAYASAGSLLIITWVLSLRSLPVFGFLLLVCFIVLTCIEAVTCIRLSKQK